MRYCENCGNQLPAEQSKGFCGQCGSGFCEPEPTLVNPESSKKKSKKPIILLSVVLLLIIVVAGFAMVHFLLPERGDDALEELLVGRWVIYLDSDMMEDDWFRVIEAEEENFYFDIRLDGAVAQSAYGGFARGEWAIDRDGTLRIDMFIEGTDEFQEMIFDKAESYDNVRRNEWYVTDYFLYLNQGRGTSSFVRADSRYHEDNLRAANRRLRAWDDEQASVPAEPDPPAEPEPPPVEVAPEEPEIPAVPDFTGEPVIIDFMWWGGGDFNAIITLFEVANPEVTVVGTPIAHSDYWQRLHTQMAAGDPSTLFLMNSIYASQFTQQEFLADLEPFIAGGIIDVSGLDRSVLESGRVNGLQSMISGGISINGYISNATLLVEYGITPPGIGQDWSWDDFILAGRAFADATVGTDKWFTFDESTEWFNFSSFVRQLDGDVFNPDGSLIVREERVTEWFTMWNMLRAEGIIPEAAISLRGKWDMFTIGDVAIASWPASALPSFQDSMAGSELTISRIPTHGDQVQRGEVIISEYFSISAFASPAEQAAAARLINFFLNDREAVDLLGFSRGVPPNRVRAEEVRANLDLNPAENRVVDFVLDLSPIARTALHHPPDIGEISAIFNDIGNLVRQGELSPEEAAQQFIQEVRRLGW